MLDKQYILISALILGALLDSLFGDPRNLPHPIRLFGATITLLEKKFNRDSAKTIKGLFMCTLLTAGTWLIFFGIQKIASYNNLFMFIYSSIFIFFGLSNKSLITEALKVEKLLNQGAINKARESLREIVGRDTSELSSHKIRMALLETMSENLSDGVIAPLFYYAIGGIPLMMTYKMVNTLDSMVGYKNERFLKFGRASAKLDDFANYIPARITAFLIFITTAKIRSFRFIIKYGRCHSSPNSGYPEAALAGALDCTLGGPSLYHGEVVFKPFIGDNPRGISHSDILFATKTNIGVFVIGLTFVILTFV